MVGEGTAAEGRDDCLEIIHLFKYSAGIGVNRKLLCCFTDSHVLQLLVSIPNSFGPSLAGFCS
jgi:hypothetical protein